MSFTFNANDIWKFGTLTVSPFDWLEASYFYYRPSDLKWEVTKIPGSYLDKGFNVKFIYKSIYRGIPNIAIGLDDFAGTGLFTREYIVSSSELNNFKYSLGFGWGKFAGNKSFKNPLSFFSENLKSRPEESKNYNLGGSLSYDQWFKGDSSIFGGIEYSIPKAKGLKIKLEYDPFNYLDFSSGIRPDALYDLRKKTSNINAGISFPFNKYITLDFSYFKGNTFSLGLNFAISLGKEHTKKLQFKPVIESDNNNSNKSFYEDLLTNLNNNNLLLQTAELYDGGKLDIAIATSEHRNAIRSSSYAAYISNEVASLNSIDLTLINIRHINAGVELNNISYITSHLKKSLKNPVELKFLYTNLDSGNTNEYKKNKFRPSIKFPVLFTSTGPSLVSHIGNPEKFYFGGINIQNITEIQFSRNLLLSTEIALPIYSNIKDTISGGGSKMEHVRTDLVQYLKEDSLLISRMQLDFIWSPYKDTYAKISGGIFESMFGGVGAEILYKPFSKNFSIGAELFYVQQRSFNQRFSFKSYKASTGHLNFSYLFPFGIETNLSFGRYLAKDDGYTFDISRRLSSGFKSGIYFTRTNVSADLFGEGSFDKGFYFQIPMDLISKKYTGNYSNFKISPLTRDGGAKLIHDKDLKGLIYNSSYNELNGQWKGFLN